MIAVKRFCGATAWAQLPETVRDRVGALLLEVIACSHLASASEAAALPALENLAEQAQGGLLDRIDAEVLDAGIRGLFDPGSIPIPSVFAIVCDRLAGCPDITQCAAGATIRCAGGCGVVRPCPARLDS